MWIDSSVVSSIILANLDAILLVCTVSPLCCDLMQFSQFYNRIYLLKLISSLIALHLKIVSEFLKCRVNRDLLYILSEDRICQCPNTLTVMCVWESEEGLLPAWIRMSLSMPFVWVVSYPVHQYRERSDFFIGCSGNRSIAGCRSLWRCRDGSWGSLSAMQEVEGGEQPAWCSQTTTQSSLFVWQPRPKRSRKEVKLLNQSKGTWEGPTLGPRCCAHRPTRTFLQWDCDLWHKA